MAREYKRFRNNQKPARSCRNGGRGQNIVKYIRKEDYAEMSRLALVHRDKEPQDSEAYYRWYRDYILMMVGVNCGSRIETILEWMPCDFAGRATTVTESKTGKRMQYDLNKEIYAELKKFIDFYHIGPKEFIFRKSLKSKDAITRWTAWKRIKDLAAEAGVAYNVGAHSLRKSYARWIYDETRDIHLVSRLLQHSDEKTTRTYIGLTDPDVDRYREQICNLPIRTGDNE